MTNSVLSYGNPPHLNACINYGFDSSRLYYEGYWEGATRLTKELKQNHMGIDLLIYPIAFLYRQYLELKLKYIIRDSRLLLDGEGSFPTHHRILELWDIVDDNLSKVIENIDFALGSYITEKDLKLVRVLIKDFSKYDPDSMAFRYPTNKSGNNHLNGLIHVNLSLLEIKMLELKSMLDKFHSAINSFEELQ